MFIILYQKNSGLHKKACQIKQYSRKSTDNNKQTCTTQACTEHWFIIFYQKSGHHARHHIASQYTAARTTTTTNNDFSSFMKHIRGRLAHGRPRITRCSRTMNDYNTHIFIIFYQKQRLASNVACRITRHRITHTDYNKQTCTKQACTEHEFIIFYQKSGHHMRHRTAFHKR